MIEDKTSLLSLFSAIQKLLHTSSLNRQRTDIGIRYDQYSDQKFLEQLDKNDQALAEAAQQMLDQFMKQLDEETINRKFPIRYKSPLSNVINKELTMYRRLLAEITKSIQGLLDTLEGTNKEPVEIETLWAKIRLNQVPEEWLRLSF